jgi:ABC-type sugar transport system substrate-binding protein
VVFGTDTDEQLANFLLADDNILQAVTGQQPFEIGRLAVEAAVKALKGEPVQKKRSLPGILLTREQPAEVIAFKEHLAALTK